MIGKSMLEVRFGPICAHCARSWDLIVQAFFGDP